jgi:hypothetical protein
MLCQHRSVHCLNAKGNFHFERTVSYRGFGQRSNLRSGARAIRKKQEVFSPTYRPRSESQRAGRCNVRRRNAKRAPVQWPGEAPLRGADYTPDANLACVHSDANMSLLESRGEKRYCVWHCYKNTIVRSRSVPVSRCEYDSRCGAVMRSATLPRCAAESRKGPRVITSRPKQRNSIQAHTHRY